MPKESLTVVLPVHNGEPRLRLEVERVLELAGELTDRFSVIIVDDGSTDDTYEAASELAARFPQVSVIRRSIRGGLGTLMKAIRKRVAADVVIVHDGVSPLQTNDVRRLWQEYQLSESTSPPAARRSDRRSVGDLADAAKLHSSLEQAHQRVIGFRLFPSQLDTTTSHEDEESIDQDADNRPRIRSDNVGLIPPLPRPNLLEAVANFALGE